MNIRSSISLIACFILTCTLFLPVAWADNWNETTKITFTEPVEIPGHVLPAGTYLFVLANNQSDRNIVRIFNADRSKLYANLLTIPTDRRNATNRTQIEFVVRQHRTPEALLKWYYPGRLTGHEFLYSTRLEKRFAQDAKREVTAEPKNIASGNAYLG
jgi:Protein of unknown function (DUF2911)